MKKVFLVLVAVIGLCFSANAQNVIPFRGLPTSLCWQGEQIVFFPKGYIPPEKPSKASDYKYDNVFELWTGGVLFQSGTWVYKTTEQSIELTIKKGKLHGQDAKFKLTKVKMNKYGFLVSAKFKFDLDNIAEYIDCSKN
ncbi:hypothetical protein FACS189434_14110 [Bacteroidia bacterium]|nr:hypothetical protein FACS189434_14110 [Bacteroidia bacterium]